MRHLVISTLLCFQLSVGSLAQQTSLPSPAQRPSTPAQEPADVDVVKITTNLVQIDAVVTDSKGKRVTDLRPDEVEMLEDGRPQKITNFAYIAGESPIVAKTSPGKSPDPNAPPVPPRKLRPEEIHRTIALVVDDLGLSFESAHYARQALKKFLDQQMQPNDLVAIIRTAGGIGALQQFTSDKRQLYAAVDKVKWYPGGRGGISAFAPISSGPTLSVPGEQKNADGLTPEEHLDQFREDLFAVGTLGALSYVVRGLRELPGRKSVVLISDGLKMFSRGEPYGSDRVMSAVRALLDLANRASVVINTMDARGLQVLGLTAADSTANLTPQELSDRLNRRNDELFDSQQGLHYLASQTGGLAIKNTNDLGAGIRRIMEDLSGYYLIGYRPDDSTFLRVNGRTKFHRVSLKVTRPGKYTVRMRSGFYGISDDKLEPPQRTPQQQLISALISPFSASGVQLRLTSLFANDAKAGSLMRSYLHIKASDLTFVAQPDGSQKATFDVLAVTFGDNGVVVDQFGYNHSVRVEANRFKQVLKDGFTYNVTVPVKKSGAYQLRIAVRDDASSKVGSAAQFITVPEFKKDRLALSGLLMKAEPLAKYRPGVASDLDGSSNDPVDKTDPVTSTAVRQFRTGMAMLYAFIIYNAKLDKASGKPQLTTQVRLFRNGQLFFTGKELPYDPSGQTDSQRLGAGGAIQLGTDMTPGEYVFQIIVTDQLAKEKHRTATQWMDFEIVK